MFAPRRLQVLHFRYLDPPEELLLLEALRQLYYYDAIDRRGLVMPLGHRMASFPLCPALARVLLHIAGEEAREDVLRVVAMLSVENVFIRPGNPAAITLAEEAKSALEQVGEDDFCTLLHIYNLAEQASKGRRGQDDLRQWCKRSFLHYRAIATALKVRDQLDGILCSTTTARRPPGAPAASDGHGRAEKRTRVHSDRSAVEHSHGGMMTTVNWSGHGASDSGHGIPGYVAQPGRHHMQRQDERVVNDEVKNAIRKALCHGYGFARLRC